MERDGRDSRQVNVMLTAEGERYARAMTSVIERLNRELVDRVDRADLVGADVVLRAVLEQGSRLRLAENLAPPAG
jgi:DNA-binding MarR family transcriptional regulator